MSYQIVEITHSKTTLRHPIRRTVPGSPKAQPRERAVALTNYLLTYSYGKRTCKPNSVVRGHSSRRRVTANAHQRPTRRFRRLLEPPFAYRADTQRRVTLSRRLPSLFGLAPCGVYPASGVTDGAVRSYRTFSPLPRHRARPPTQLRRTHPGTPFTRRGDRGGMFSVALAVCGP